MQSSLLVQQVAYRVTIGLYMFNMLIPERYSQTKENLGYREEYKRKAREDIHTYIKSRKKIRITSIYQPTNAHIISHKTLLKHFKTL